MNRKKHQSIIYFVAVTIAVTLVVQVYWNYINYQANKSELVNQVQISLDNAVEAYYANLAKANIFVMKANSAMEESDHHIHSILKKFGSDSILDIDTNFIKGSRSFRFTIKDTVLQQRRHIDSLEIKMLASKILVSISDKEIDFNQLAGILNDDFTNKNWPIQFGLLYRDIDCANRLWMMCDSVLSYGEIQKDKQLMASSKSVFLPERSELDIYFSNMTTILLKRSLVGIFLSLLLSAAIIFCLLYLLKTIRQQKQLVEIKNDLISNITHEFKTPITTVVAALEGIESFNALEDKAKTKKYLDISNEQLGKLNIMVEKLLETATLDSENLQLSLESVNLNELINSQLAKYRITAEAKTFHFETPDSQINMQLDPFHFENVIGNILDNAIKYGGDSISVDLKSDNSTIDINIIDNGNGIAKDQRSKIFDKFYRVPTGNLHEVKGFGIGLYYSKKIVEKHGGTLELLPDNDKTIFKISFSNAN